MTFSYTVYHRVYSMVMCLCLSCFACPDDLLTMKACPPSEEEFVDIFQKLKYSLSLLVRLYQHIHTTLNKKLYDPIFLVYLGTTQAIHRTA